MRGTPTAADWLVGPAPWNRLRERLAELVAAYAFDHPYEDGPAVETARQHLELPAAALVKALVTTPLRLRADRIVPGAPELPAAVAAAVRHVAGALTERPFAAPDAPRPAELGLGRREIAVAARAGVLLRLSDSVVLLPDAPAKALTLLDEPAQPFSVSDACHALGTTRRVALPLLTVLDREGRTRRLHDSRRRLVARGGLHDGGYSAVAHGPPGGVATQVRGRGTGRGP
ncbi:SelB C-terminal domain-containing protein [Streptomyces sp. 184]|uniref:SelB domain-containing protein n=1 Tax=Streptomyces sp. 184 TaxID=1827526 RepID=UPI003891BD13